jgi:hypothetical protein
VVCSLQRAFSHLMLPHLLSFKVCIVNPAHPKGQFTVSGTVLFITSVVGGSQGISVSIVTKLWAG